jgi:hypothetical protein
MTAAILQGVMMNTLDVDIWVDLPTRLYMRRDKDLGHIPEIEKVLKAKRATGGERK